MGFNLPPVAENTTVYNVEAGDFSYSRVYLEGYNRPVSNFILRTEDIKGLSAEQIAQKYALSKVPDKIVTVELPIDTPLEVSIVGPQESWGTLGGDVQYAIKDADLNPSWFENIIVVLMYDDIFIPNNVIVLDYKGEQLCTINDILKIKKPTGNIDIEKTFENKLNVFSSLGIVFCINVDRKELIKKDYLR